ncbi:MAG TPA: hypothetical protein VFO60_10410 [Candidatus Dormibacteraeota bacterium]|nr:hypothetical protein [Candidatus Dormibacteraeota bacterium]
MLERQRARRPRALPMDIDSRTARAAHLVQRLAVDLARMGAGEDIELEYLEPLVAELLREGYRGYARAGVAIDADYGESAAVTAAFSDDDGDGEPVMVEARIDERSVLTAADGLRTPLPAARWSMRLRLDARCERVLGVRIEGEW